MQLRIVFFAVRLVALALGGALAATAMPPAADAQLISGAGPGGGGGSFASFVAAMPAGSWKAIPSSTLNPAIYQNDTTNSFSRPALGNDYNATLATNIRGNTGPFAIIGAWGGATFDPVNEKVIVWGGGHNDYFGNEVYVFPLQSLGPWQRVTTPANPIGVSCTGDTMPDGSPNIVHTYGRISYLPSTGEMIVFGGGTSNAQGCANGTDFGDTFAFNFSTFSWLKINSVAFSPTVNHDMLTGYNATDGSVYQVSGGLGVVKLNRGTALWGAVGSSGLFTNGHMSGVLAPSLGANGKFFAVGHNTVDGATAFNVADLSTGVVTTPVPTGATACQEAQSDAGTSAQGAPGVAWDSTAGLLTCWAGNAVTTSPPGAGSTVYTLDPATNVWTAHTATCTGSDCPTAPATNGTFGRFIYDPTNNVLIVVNDVSDLVRVYKKNY